MTSGKQGRQCVGFYLRFAGGCRHGGWFSVVRVMLSSCCVLVCEGDARIFSVVPDTVQLGCRHAQEALFALCAYLSAPSASVATRPGRAGRNLHLAMEALWPCRSHPAEIGSILSMMTLSTPWHVQPGLHKQVHRDPPVIRDTRESLMTAPNRSASVRGRCSQQGCRQTPTRTGDRHRKRQPVQFGRWSRRKGRRHAFTVGSGSVSSCASSLATLPWSRSLSRPFCPKGVSWGRPVRNARSFVL